MRAARSVPAAVLPAFIIALLFEGAPLSGQSGAPGAHWPQWRGPHAAGSSTTANPPLTWSETRNVKWKAPLAGRGNSTPVIWGDRIFVTTAVPEGVTGEAQHAPRGGVPDRDVHRFVVMALDRHTGKTIWERTARTQAPHEGSHFENGTWASSSPITDGRGLYVYFESFGLYAYDLDGRLLWEKDFGDKRMRQEFGEGSTPALFGNTLVVVWDHLNGQSFVTAVDTRDGKELWRVPHAEIDTWATPLVVEVNGRAQVIVPAMERVRAYDLQNGGAVWESDGLTMNTIPSPVHADGLVFLMSGFRGNDLKAIRVADAKGNIDGTPAVAWTMDRDTPYVPSPLIHDGILYFLKGNNGILTAVDARTGRPHYSQQRLDGVPNVFASPVAAGGRVYVPGRDGATAVVKSGPAFEMLARNTLDDSFDASPALAEGVLYLRGYKNLYALEEK